MKIDNQKLNEIDLTKLSNLLHNDSQYKSYFLSSPGKEHYSLLAYFSTLFSGSTLIDIGTFKGGSALALSYNPSASVISFDIQNNKNILAYPKNLTFIIDWISLPKYKQMILSSPFILLDTYHDGSFENLFYHYLIAIGWKGYLLLDDIYLNEPMKEFWESIYKEKFDLTEYGHWSGTGLVIFK